MKRLLLSGLAVLALAPAGNAIVDFNNNGVSDLWEKQYNSGGLFPDTFDPQADPDADGWTNAREAAAGTNPSDPNPPDGLIRPEIARVPAVMSEPDEEGYTSIITPQAVTVTWPTIPGKQYTLLFSTDLTEGGWIPVGAPFIGSGSMVTYGFGIHDSDKRFWRVAATDADTDGDSLTDAEENELGSSIYLADTDGDGLSDPDELFVHHTNPNSRDSDGDGVSDWYEIMVNFTNPLTATDADGDGIPDDQEKDLAKQFLSFEPDPAAWGDYYAGLVSGDSDATHDYTDEDISAGELAGLLRNIPTDGSPASGYLVESQMRRNALQWAFYSPASPANPYEYAEGMYWQSEAGGFGVRSELTSPADFTPAYLVSHIAAMAWEPDPTLAGWDFPISAYYYSDAASGFLQTPEWSAGITKYQGYIRQRKFRAIASRADHEPFSEQYLKITSKREFQEIGIGEVLAAEHFPIRIPKGKFFTEWFESKAEMVDGQDTAVSLRPVEVGWKAIDGFDNVSDHIDPWTDKPNGKRIFPDYKNPDDTAMRDKLEVIVKTSPALVGKTVHVKAFDVDDSTSEDFDKDKIPGSSTFGNTVIDIHGKAGDDNLADYKSTPENGHFWAGSNWGGDTANSLIDANGEAKLIFGVGMQPGNNYRIVASVVDESMYAGVQTTDPAVAKYLGPESGQTGGAPASPLLTVWRRLWVENDPMGAIPTDTFGYKRNDLSHDLTSPITLTKLSDGTNTSCPRIVD